MKKRELFQETLHSVHSVTEVLEENGTKKWIISGAYTEVDKPNGNNRVYPKETMQKAIEAIRPQVASKKIRMCLDHPEYESKLADVAAILTEIGDVQPDGKAYYKAQIIDTEKGKTLKAILDAGSPVGVSTRGYGNVQFDKLEGFGDAQFAIIQPGFKLETIDFVDIPSVSSTEDNIHLESKENKMKTLDELKQAYPDILNPVFEGFESEKKSFETKIAELTKVVETSKASVSKLVDSVKEVSPDSFTTITTPETDVIKAKDEEIKKAVEETTALKNTMKTLTEQVAKIEAEKIQSARNSEIDKLRADDPEYFKNEGLVKKFENCLTSEEVRKCYEATMEIIKLVKETAAKTPETKTKIEDPTPKVPTLTDAQKSDFEYRNSQRLASGITPMTVESYLKSFVK